MKDQAMITGDLATKLQFPSIEQMMLGAIFGTAMGIVIGLWLKNRLDKRLVDENNRLQKLPQMTWYKKSGPLTSIWRMLGA